MKPKTHRANKAVTNNLPNLLKLRGTQNIFIAEKYREVDKVVRRDSRTLVIKHKVN